MFPLSQTAVAALVVVALAAAWFVSFRLIGGEHAGAVFTVLLFLGIAGVGWLFCPHDVPLPPDDPNIS